MAIAVWIRAADTRRSGGGYRSLASHPQRGVNRVDVKVADIIAAQCDVVDPDEIL